MNEELELCLICEEPADDGRALQHDLDGNVAHIDCLETIESEEEE